VEVEPCKAKSVLNLEKKNGRRKKKGEILSLEVSNEEKQFR